MDEGGRLEAARESDRLDWIKRRAGLEATMQRLNRSIMITFGALAFLGPLSMNMSTLVVRSRYGFDARGFRPTFYASMIGIGIMVVVLTAVTVYCLLRRRSLQRQLGELTPFSEGSES